MTHDAGVCTLVHVDERTGERIGIELAEGRLAAGAPHAPPERRVASEPLDATGETLGVAWRVGQRIHAIGDELVRTSPRAPDDVAPPPHPSRAAHAHRLPLP